MIQGRIGHSTGSPMMPGLVYIPRLEIDREIYFLVDTGATRTTLMPVDSREFGIQVVTCARQEEVIGVSGPIVCGVEEAIASFVDDVLGPQWYRFELYVAPCLESINELPSLLGRDLLQNWQFEYAAMRNRARMEVIRPGT